jgi:hypothetical protein
MITNRTIKEPRKKKQSSFRDNNQETVRLSFPIAFFCAENKDVSCFFFQIKQSVYLKNI